MAQRLTGVSRSLSHRMPPHRADRRGKSARRGKRTGARHRACPRVKVRRGKSPVRQPRGFPYRHGLRDGLVRQGRVSRTAMVSAMDWYWSGQMTFCRRKVRLRVICPAEGRFSGENRLPAQIRPEPGFGGQIHANREFVRQTRPSPYRLVSAMDWFGKARVSRTERSRCP